MTISLWRQKIIERLIADYGAHCHYCPTPVRLRIAARTHHKDDATVDHKIPRTKGGTNDYTNLLLACYSCNNAKGDQDYDEFKRDPRPAHIKERARLKAARAAQHKRVKDNPPWHLPRAKLKLGSGTMAAAIENGSMTENGEWRKPLPIPTWTDWPWLCELMAPLVRDVGFGPWK